MRIPEDPPPPPRQPFLPHRTPPSGGTLRGLDRATLLPPAPPAVAPGAAAAAPHEAALERHVEGLRLELVLFREVWWPEQLRRLGPARARARAWAGLQRPGAVVAAGVALALALMLASAVAAVRWPAFGHWAAQVGAPGPGPSTR